MHKTILLLIVQPNLYTGKYNGIGERPFKNIFLLFTPTLANLCLYYSTYLSLVLQTVGM